MRVFRTRGLVWPLLFAPMLLVVWLSSSAGVVEEVSAEPMAQTSPVPTLPQTHKIILESSDDDAGPFYTACSNSSNTRGEIYIGYCGDNGQSIVSGFRFQTGALAGISIDEITDVYIEFNVERLFTNSMASIQINGHATANSPSFSSSPPSARPLTAASAIWEMISWENIDGSPYYPDLGWLGMVNTPSLMPILNELHQNHNWEMGSPLTFILQPEMGSTPPPPNPNPLDIYSRRITAHDHPHIPNARARLVVEYDASVPVTPSFYLGWNSDLQATACKLVDSIAMGHSATTSLAFISIGKPSDDPGDPTSIDKLKVFESPDKKTYDEVGQKIIDFAKAYTDCAVQRNLSTKLTLVAVLQGYDQNIDFYTGKLWGHQMAKIRIAWRSYGIMNPAANRVDLVAGGDIETIWNSGQTYKDWVRGIRYYTQPFISVAALIDAPEAPLTVPINKAQEFNRSFTVNSQSSWPTSQLYWTVEEIVAVTAHPLIISLPQIYNVFGNQAKPWYYLTAITNTPNRKKYIFEGVLTQYGACRQRPCHASEMNTPYQAWQQILDIHNNPSTTFEGRINLRYMTDVCWAASDVNVSYCGFVHSTE